MCVKGGTPVPIQRGQMLDKALEIEGYKNIPSNVILDKTLPGTGATYCEIHSERHSIIIEPNVPVIIGKTNSSETILGVHGNFNQKKIVAYLRNNSIRWKKIITTPESFCSKVLPAATKAKVDIYNTFFCLFDECEKILQDYDYRKRITQPMGTFFDFKNKAFVSATPIEFSDPRFEQKGFRILKVVPQYDYKKELNLIITNDFDIALRDYINEHKESDCVCIFYNSTEGINSIINTFEIVKADYKVFCSKKSVEKLKKKEFKEVNENIELPQKPLAKFNFFTCRFYSAVDIIMPDRKPDILILTNIAQAGHTRIDPETEAIQIYGRFRKGFNSLTHITTYKNEELLNIDQINNYIIQLEENYSQAKKNAETEINVGRQRAHLEEFENHTYKNFLDLEGQFSYFAKDNYINEERVKGYYINPDTIELAYNNTEHFYVHSERKISKIPSTRLLSLKKETGLKQRKEIVAILDNHTISEPFENDNLIVFLKDINELIVDAYFKLGKEKIEELKYNKSKIENKIQEHDIEKYLFSVDFAKIVYNRLDQYIGKKLDKNFYKDKLLKIYQEYDIKFKITQDTIRDYYYGSISNSVKPATFTPESHKIDVG